jgi:hypothetical protein
LSSIVPNLHRKLYIFFNTTIMIQLIFYQPWLSPHFQHHTKSSWHLFINFFGSFYNFLGRCSFSAQLIVTVNESSQTWVVTNLQYRLVNYNFDEIIKFVVIIKFQAHLHRHILMRMEKISSSLEICLSVLLKIGWPLFQIMVIY